MDEPALSTSPATSPGHPPHRAGRPACAIAVTLAAVVVLVGVFAPWLKSGSSQRSSFELFDLAERLGFARDGVFAWAVRPWPLVPLLVVAAAVAAWTGRHRLASALAGVGGLYVGGVVIGVKLAPEAALIRTTWGVPLSGAGAVAMIGVAVWLLTVSRATRHG